MDVTADNIVVGHPANIKIASYEGVEGGATDIGFTEGGARIIPTNEYYQHKADQALGAVDVTVTGRSYVLEFNMAEATLQNLLYATGLDSGAINGTTSLKFGNTTTVDKYTIYVNGKGPGVGATRKVTIHKAVSIGNPEYAYMKDDKTIYACQFLVLQDMSKDDDQEFYIVEDSGVDATAPEVAPLSPVEDASTPNTAKGVITLTFTETGVGMDQGTLIYGNTVMINNVTDQAATALVAGSISYAPTTKILTFTPTNDWNAGDKLSVVITTAVKDMAGNALVATHYSHFTVAT